MRRRHIGTALAGLGLLASAGTAQAQPFGVFDVRAAGMGGVGVATGARYATFNNPALLTTADEQREWFLMAPGMGRQRGDPDDLKDNLTTSKQAANTLDASPTIANRDAVLASLNAMGGGIYRESGNTAILLAIPSRLLSGAAYIHIYDWANARASIAGDNLSDPTNPQYASRIEHRGAQVLENGITAAKSISGTGWRRQLAVGFNVKFLFVEGYGYSEDVRDAKTSIDRNQYSSSAAFNLDIGVLKEFGIWKLGLMAKNLFSGSFEYGDTGDYFDIAPQLRAGFAYQSRRTVFELDLDLTRNQAAGFDSVTQMAALGVEFKPWRWLALRSGYQQNLLGTQVGTASLGLGAALGRLTFDIAVSHSEEQDGAHAQLGFQF
ncbi:MAG TPA: hypothetical protein ENH21_03675 [Chromatiales bacterium]|nr:hypothetical protein [Chromatiales bacterium]HEX22510.1 hypothetical protein [Chromatiales bacterium]